MSIFKLPVKLESSYNYYDNSIDKKKKKNNNSFIKKGTIYEALELSDKIDGTSDNIEKLIYFNKLKNLKENSIVFKNIIEYVQEKLHKSLLEDSELEYPVGLDIQSFYTPNEIKENNLLTDKSSLNWYNELDFRIKGIGINSNKLHFKSIGWNDILDYNQENIIKSVKRLNRIIKNDLDNFNFINLTNTPFENNKTSRYKGITTYIIHGETKNNFVPNILFSIDNNSNNIYSFQKNGHIILNTKLSINDILNEYKWNYFSVFFIPLSEESDNLIKQNIKNIDLLNLINSNNFISRAGQIFPNSNLQILNDKLVMINLLSIYNCIIYGNEYSKKEIIEMLISNPINNRQYIYILFKGNKEEFNNNYIFNKLDKIRELNIDTDLNDSISEGYYNIKEFNNILLNESNILNNKYDYLNRVDYDSLF